MYMHAVGLCMPIMHAIKIAYRMLLKLPIVLLSNAAEFCLLCSNYASEINH